MARQKLGQHFLTNSSILERIAQAACPAPGEPVIEIGPGRGALTEKLLKRAGRVLAIELDHELAAYLRSRFPNEPNLEVVEADVLDTNLTGFGPAAIAGNLPYYITSPIIEKTLRARPPRAVFLVQKEVAERLTAQPGTRNYGFLTVEVAVAAEARLLFAVPPGAFRPPPKVDSAVVLLEPRKQPPMDDLEGFLRFAGHCFQHKRKTIRNNLGAVYGRGVVDSWPEAGLRAEQIPVAQFIEMYRRLNQAPRDA